MIWRPSNRPRQLQKRPGHCAAGTTGQLARSMRRCSHADKDEWRGRTVLASSVPAPLSLSAASRPLHAALDIWPRSPVRQERRDHGPGSAAGRRTRGPSPRCRPGRRRSSAASQRRQPSTTMCESWAIAIAKSVGSSTRPGPPASAYAARMTRRPPRLRRRTRRGPRRAPGTGRRGRRCRSRRRRGRRRACAGRCRPRGRDGTSGGRAADRRGTPPGRPAPGRSASSSSANGARRPRSVVDELGPSHRPDRLGVPRVEADRAREVDTVESATQRAARPPPDRGPDPLSWRSTQPWSLTRAPPQTAMTSPVRVRRTAGVAMPAASTASWNAAPSSSSATSSSATSPTCLTAQLPRSVSSRQIEPSRPLATGPPDSRPHDPRSNASRMHGT